MRRLRADSVSVDELLAEATRTVVDGGVLIFPTETVYGIGCDPFQPAAVERIFAGKGRSRDKPLALHLATREEALEYVGSNAAAALAVRRFLPGPLAVVVARPDFIDSRVTGGLPSLSLRVPAHALCAAILDACGPLAATSANLSGRAPFLGGASGETLPEADLFIDAGPVPIGVASTVLDFTTEPPTLVRDGAVPRAALEAIVGTIR
jgi:L-threonylcarbamoyladenylate synthase